VGILPSHSLAKTWTNDCFSSHCRLQLSPGFHPIRVHPGARLTLILDALKGLAAVVITRMIFPGNKALLGTAALFAIVGHMFPVWLRFRGGKGVATGLGSFVILTPKTILVMLFVFVVIFVAFRYVSLASILTVALFPLLAWILEPDHASGMIPFILAACVLIVAKHHENIRRLLAHTESRFHWRRA
jgi:acyl phosphate:glycerol-3-phosphate acyltransferase